MPANNRIFYACQAVAMEKLGSSGNMTPIHGLQSVGVNTTFNLEQVFELGQIQIYENIEGIPDIEMTLEKVLDGYPLIYHLATSGASSAGLVGRSKERACVALGVYSDAYDSASGAAPVELYMSGMYMSNVSYKIPTDGNCTESVTMVGNHKAWFPNNDPATNAGVFMKSTVVKALNNIDYSTGAGQDEPLALISGVNSAGGAGGIQRRENVLLGSSILPMSIYGVYGSGCGNAGSGTLQGTIMYTGIATANVRGYDKFGFTPNVHVQSFDVSTDFSRDPILELGRKAPYYRAAKFPVEVTSNFEIIAISGDFVNAYEEGISGYRNTRNEGNNTSQERIVMALHDGTVIDLGSKNRLSSITYGGGDAGGGNATIKYSYSTFNDLYVYHPQDPRKNLTGDYKAP
jgi:hypothetical protein